MSKVWAPICQALPIRWVLHSVHWGINLHTIPPSFFHEPLPPTKTRIFLWIPKILKFFILHPIYLSKVTKFLPKISQFKFLVTTEQSVFVCKTFLSINVPDFSLFFVEKLQPAFLKNVTPFPPSNPPVKMEVCQAPSLFENLVGSRLNSLPLQRKVGGYTLCFVFLYYGKLMEKPIHFPYDEVYRRMRIQWEKTPITWENYEYQFPRFSPYDWFCYIFE